MRADRSTAAKRARTTLKSSSLRTKPSAPASNARNSWLRSSKPVSSKHGVFRNTASSRMRRTTVAPSMPGNPWSTITAAGRWFTAECNPSSPVARGCYVVASGLQGLSQFIAEGHAVVDHENCGAVVRGWVRLLRRISSRARATT